MPLGTPLAVLLTIVFIVPGLIWKQIADLCSPYVKRKKFAWHESFMLSCLNYLVGLLPVYFLLLYCPSDLSLSDPRSIIKHPWYTMSWLSLVFVQPAILGYMFGLLAMSRKVKARLRKVGIRMLHPAATAWDYAFAREERYWARIKLSDGEYVEGMFDANSLASGEIQDRDIFLEAVFEFDEKDGDYKPLERNAGILLKGEHIQAITFFNVEAPQECQTPADSQDPA